MQDRRAALLGAALVTVLMVISSMGLLGGLGGASAGHPSLSPSMSAVASPAAPAGAAAGSGSLGHSVFGSTPTAPAAPSSARAAPENMDVSPVVAKVEAQIADHQINPAHVFLPNAYRHIAGTGGAGISPTYPGMPAPMGLADLGVGAGGDYEYNTTSFASYLNLTSFQDYNPGYAGWNAPPNYMTFQLNTVTVNVTYPGGSQGDFWIQNVATFNGTTLQFEDNIWNMSSPNAAMETGTLATYEGTLVPGEYYYAIGPAFQVNYPFQLNLYNNITSGGGVPGVYFNYTITNVNYEGTYYPVISSYYDHVTFNGTTSVSSPPEFQVNGYNYNPLGLLWDAELIFGGNGGGSNAVITGLSGTENLDFWNGASYQTIPSAYDYGEDTGETAVGVAATYVGTTELLNQGPSLQYGLWNTVTTSFGPAASPGWIQADFGVDVNYAFNFVQNESDYNTVSQNWSYAPTDSNGYGVTELPPVSATNMYYFAAWADGYNPFDAFGCDSNATCDFIGFPTLDPTNFDAPVYLDSYAQVTKFGGAGIPGVSLSNVLGLTNLSINRTTATLAPAFRQLNDFEFNTFVLFAGLNLNTSVYLNGLVQNATSSNYTWSRTYGQVLYLPAWSQGYYFNYGNGSFTVTNTTVTGGQDVEFWSTFFSAATNVVTSGDSFGVDVLQGNYTNLINITSETGANAIAVMNSDDTYGLYIDSNGTDANDVPSWAAYLFEDEGVGLYYISATNGGLGIYSDEVEYFDFGEISISNGPAAAELFEDAYGDVYNVVVNDSFGIYAESFVDISFDNFTVTNGSEAGSLYESDYSVYWGWNISNSAGLYLGEGAYVTVGYINATGNATEGVDEIYNAFDVFVTNVSATHNAAGVIVEDATNVTVANVSSAVGAFGVGILGATNVSVANVSVSDGSAGALVEASVNVTVTNVTVSGIGVGVGVIDDEDVFVEYVNSTAAAPGPEYFSTSSIRSAPNTAVASIDNLDTIIYHVSATNDGFAVADNGTNELLVLNVTSWGAQVGIQFNGTTNATVAQAFLFGSFVGVFFFNTTNVELEASTIEASTAFGINVQYGASVWVLANNFVDNNGASTDGTFSASHVQAAEFAVTYLNFTDAGVDGNYWSDWTPASGAYPIAAGVTDTDPQVAFISQWLEFVETGLPAGTAWGFTLGAVTYTTTAPLVFIPAWSLGDPTLAYTVNAPLGYTPSPGSGSVDFTGINTTVTISFTAIPYTVSFVETGLPSGTSWSVTFDGTTTPGTTGTIVFTTTVGTYSYSIGAVAGYTALPSSGSVSVTDTDLTVDIAYSPVTYPVTVSETGLAAGTSWSVTLNGVTTPSTTSSVAFAEPNGSYTYTVGAVAGYSASPTTGSVLVSGGPASASITFTAVTPVTYSVTFTETGLPTGGTWTVTLAGAPKTEATGTSIVFTGLGNDSYSYSVGAVTGYTSSPSSSSVTVDGNSPTVAVTFTATSPSPPGTPSGSSGLSTLDWGIIGLVIVLIIVALAIALTRRGRGGASTTPPANTLPPAAPPPTAAAPPPWSEGGTAPPPNPSEGPP